MDNFCAQTNNVNCVCQRKFAKNFNTISVNSLISFRLTIQNNASIALPTFVAAP